jgi:hypothetical protein
MSARRSSPSRFCQAQYDGRSNSQAPPAMRLCHHLHGGMGMDITYPMDRYYSSIKDLTRLLGGPTHRLDLVGA